MRNLTLAVLLLVVEVGTTEQPQVAAWQFLRRLLDIRHIQADTDVNGFDESCCKCKVQLRVYGYQAILMALVSNCACCQ